MTRSALIKCVNTLAIYIAIYTMYFVPHPKALLLMYLAQLLGQIPLFTLVKGSEYDGNLFREPLALVA